MTATPLNPFRPTRWEQQRDGYQLIWYTKTADQLVSEKSVFVRGSRGSGKTTLLKSICWEDLAENSSLRLQRKLADFEHIGIYIRFPDHISASLSSLRWSEVYPLSPNATHEFHRFFSLVVELTCAERALVACHELRLRRHLELGSGSELNLVGQVLREFPALAHLDEKPPSTFLHLARMFRNLVRLMNEASGRGVVQGLAPMLPAREPGELLSYVSSQLSDAVRMVGSPSRRAISPRFKFCLDDCEVLSPQQQISLNTLVRVAKQPVSWAVSYVGTLFEITETYLLQQPLTDADRRIVSLDTRTDSDFRELCQAVVSLRLYFSVSEEARMKGVPSEIGDFFALDARLGRRSVNDMMAAIAQRSASPAAQRLLEAARNLRDLLVRRNKRYRIRFQAKPDSLPLYESYVLLLWQGKEDAFKATFSEADEAKFARYAPNFGKPAFDAWLRRKQRAALLHFATSLGFRRLPLAGSNVILSLADGTVRDFLEILGEIYETYSQRHRADPASTAGLDRFVLSGSAIAGDTQADGIFNASLAYLKGVSARAEREADILVRLLEGLGHYTSILQTEPSDPTVLGRAERGVFILRFLGEPATREEELDQALWNTIRRAEVAGYLKSVDFRLMKASEVTSEADLSGRVATFRLHRRFAPHFRFSYRGAYESVVLSSRDLWTLCDRSSASSPRAWAAAMGRRALAEDPAQLPLPLSLITHDE